MKPDITENAVHQTGQAIDAGESRQGHDITEDVRYALSKIGVLKTAGSVTSDATELRSLAERVARVINPVSQSSVYIEAFWRAFRGGVITVEFW